MSNPHGKILRINKDGTIPQDNPFVGQPGKLGAIWAYGFRNPWRFQFDQVTGQLFGGDVGDFSWEELNHIVPGGNYGWPAHEGVCTSGCAGYTDPIHTWPHNGQSAAATGGPVYRGSMFPAEYQGNLFFGDYAQGFIKRAVLNPDGSVAAVHTFDQTAGAVVDLKVAPDGSLYYLNFWPGQLMRVSYNTTSHVPVASASANVTKGVEPLTVHFSSAGSFDPDEDVLSYLWIFGDGSTSTEANPTHVYTETGVYTARLTVLAGGESSLAQPIPIQVGIPPTLTVSTPVEGQLYRSGDTITYNAFASDGAGFDLNDAGIKTSVRLHHGSHYHPFAGPLTGRAGSFTIPTTGEASADTSYEVTVTATDTNGLSTSKVITIVPRTANLTFLTSPPGLPLQLDGIPITGGYSVQGVSGFERGLNAPPFATAQDGTALQFAGWSDGATIRRTITTPDVDSTYTANYVPVAPFTGTYFDNINLEGTPVLTRQDPAVNFDWGDVGPVESMPHNGFSVRWTKKQWFGVGRYTFSALADDGVRLYVDNQRVIDKWTGPANVEHTYTADLGEGLHTITYEFLEFFGGAVARLNWASALDQPNLTYRAEYWNLPGFQSSVPAANPTLARDEPTINHDWGEGSPHPSIAHDQFAARFTKTLNLAPGEYEFSVTTDDGVRLVIDGATVIDKWIDQAPTTYTARLPMDGAPHSLVLEYYEHAGGAVAKFGMQRVGDIPDQPAYHAEYWNNPDGGGDPPIPARAPDMAGIEAAVGFEWFGGSPAPSIAGDNFIARWTRTDVLSAGLYRFSGVADDGLRVFVDDVPVVDIWHPQHVNYSVEKVLTAGPHNIRIEYFESGGDATATVHYDRIGNVQPQDGFFDADYFVGRDLAGAPVLSRQEGALNHQWGAGSPAPSVPADNFSARWTKTLQLAAGNYKFTTTTDDGVRLFVDGTPVIDKWVQQSPTAHSAVLTLNEGSHQVVMEYFEGGGDANARLVVEPTTESPPTTGPVEPFTAEYFANDSMSGVPALTRTDNTVDFDWGWAGSPDPTIPADHFSARWTRTKEYAAGPHRFTVTGDDGIRVLVDGNLVIDGWRDQSPTTYTADVELTAGPHTVVIEYFERSGGASARYSDAAL